MKINFDFKVFQNISSEPAEDCGSVKGPWRPLYLPKLWYVFKLIIMSYQV